MNVIPQRVRDGFGKLIEPLAVVFIRLHIRPNLITTVGTLVVIASATAFALGASLIVSYTRARAEALGLTAKVGIAQRAERVLLLGVPTLFFGAGNHGALLFWIVVVLALATSVTVVQRVLYVARVAGEPAVRRPPRQRDTLPGHAPALQSRKGP